MGLFKLGEAFSKNGIGEGMNARDLSRKHGVALEAIEDQIEKGIRVELEHTSDLDKARQIAIDHLSEVPDYYEKLKKMEDNAKAAEKKLTEEFSSFLESEIDELKAEIFTALSESEIGSDKDIKSWADWKLTKFNLRSVDESFADAFLEELNGDAGMIATMTRRDKILQVIEAAESMPRSLKDKLTEMDGVKGEKRSRVVSAAIKNLKSKKQ
jgi:hypothetical protein